MNFPLCSAVMVTGKSAKHYQYAILATDSFVRQTYKEKQLVIVNDGYRSLDLPDSRVKEIRVPEKKTLGELRNIGLDNADGDWILQWDDDDVHHVSRMRFQMMQRRKDKCQLLKKQLRANVLTGVAFRYQDPVGIAGTILHPKTDARYAAKSKGEDSDFWLRVWGKERRQLLDDDNRVHYYLRLYHGNNTWDRSHIMKGMDSRKVPPEFQLTRVEREYVKNHIICYST